MKAQHLRHETGDNRYIAPLEQAPKLSIGARFNHTVSLPFKILFHEPMLIATTVYMSVIMPVPSMCAPGLTLSLVPVRLHVPDV